jgi:uncharacterized membrane protein
MKNTKHNHQCEVSRKTHSRNGRQGPTLKIGRFFGRTAASLLLATVVYALPARSQIVSFDATTNSEFTEVQCINPAGAVTGSYAVPRQGLLGFVRKQNGQITTFGAPTTNDVDPQGIGINSAGEVVGPYLKFDGSVTIDGTTYSSYSYSSFLRLANGTVINIDPTNSYSSTPYCINEKGTVAGNESDASDGSTHFFLRAIDGTSTEFDPEPGAYPVSMGINNKGAAAGAYYDVDGNLRSFLRTAQGAITLFDEPDAVNGTVADSINPSGEILGIYYDASYTAHGFVLSPQGQFTTFDPQGSTGTYPSAGCGNAPDGVVAGSYSDANGVYHGFVRASNGQITTFDPEGSVKHTGRRHQSWRRGHRILHRRKRASPRLSLSLERELIITAGQPLTRQRSLCARLLQPRAQELFLQHIFTILKQNGRAAVVLPDNVLFERP